ncbi:MAG: c-type cytochrome [Limisphaerales bacterium]
MSPELNNAATPYAPSSLTHLEDRDESTDVSGIHAAVLREKADPKEGMEPISLWLIALTGVLLFWGGYYLQRYSGGFKALQYDEKLSGEVLTVAAKPAALDPLAAGKQVFAVCSGCHMTEGQGDSSRQIPPLAGSEWVNDASSAKVVRFVLKGLKGPIKVKGQDYPGTDTTMLSLGDNLTDADIAAVLTYVRSSWGNKAPSVSGDEVAKIRDAIKSRTDQWTVAEVEKDVAATGAAAPATTTTAAAPKSPAELETLLKSLPPDQLKQVLDAISPKK